MKSQDKNNQQYKVYSCDLCGADEPIEMPYCRLYTKGQAIHICGNCGFVYVRKRRSSDNIARVWSEEIYGEIYTAVKNPAMIARQTFVAEFLAGSIDLVGLKVCDIGAGEGYFLSYLKDRYGIIPYGIEPSKFNCNRLEKMGICSFQGTIENFIKSQEAKDYCADVVSIMWTLENCTSCVDMLKGAGMLLQVGSKILVATGSRILVPFKKPLFNYLSYNPADSHCFRFSANSLRAALAISGFRVLKMNHFIDNDILCFLAEKVSTDEKIDFEKDSPLEVYSFFERWHKDTVYYLKHNA